ncbi:MAG TPA: hypothetical protein VHW65_04905, partial [Gemmatimonadales bacterium]|nr:hypothetical protein [Gemmatimonadales bacterium]
MIRTIGCTLFATLTLVGRATAQQADSADAWLVIHVVDVGQGDGIWLHTCNDHIAGNGRCDGKNIVIDGGPTGLDA